MLRGASLKRHLAMLVLLLAMLYTSRAGKVCIDRDASYAEIQQDYAPDEIIVKFKNTVADTLEEQRLDDSNLAQLGLSSSVDKLNKKFSLRNIRSVFKNFKANRERLKDVLKKDKTLLTKQEKRILQRLKRADKRDTVPDLDRIYKLQFDLEPDKSIQDALAAYNRDPSVEYAELNYIVSINSMPNDPLYPIQWPLNNTGQVYPESGYYNHPPGTPDCDIDAPETWDAHTARSEVIAAVVDTGVDYTHRDLQNNMWVNETEANGDAGSDDDGNGYVDDIYGYDFINGDGNPIDDHGHGTHCSGIIAAEGNNGVDIAGICWNGRIMALKFLGSDGTGYYSDAVTALYYAVENGADVISCSWGGDDYSETLKEVIDYAHSRGLLMIASAGNNNSSSRGYPAYYDHMIAVAATNSNDQKALFSNYGNWIDIAAPGVDVLSLRGDGTSMGTIYDDYTTIASGTSMACPHVAGACALLLSTNPTLTSDEVYDILMEEADPIAPGICLSNGRLNLFNTVLAAPPSQGRIHLNCDYYSCDSVVGIRVGDCDLAGKGSLGVTLETSGGDFETVLLGEDTPAVGVFTGTISTTWGNSNIEDGILQISHGEIITATYEDTNDGTGNPATVTDTAEADCQEPLISNVMTNPAGPEPEVVFETDEPVTARVLCGLNCGGAYVIVQEDPILTTSHTMRLTGVEPETEYYFVVEATDVVGNVRVDDNNGACYTFTTDSGPRGMYVPGEYTNIQKAIDVAWDGATVWVADGTYRGVGNRDIYFKGKAITVRSENGPENCIVDCYGGRHCGFIFCSGEGPNSVLDGFTITNGRGYYIDDYLKYRGGGIYCYGSSPTIQKCIIHNNSAYIGGGMACYFDSRPVITDCNFSANSAVHFSGGGMFNDDSSLTLTNCTFSDNSAHDSGGGIANLDSNLILTNCTFSGNSADDYGGVIYNCVGTGNATSSLTVINCVFSGNSAVYKSGGVIFNDAGTGNATSSLNVKNCVFSGNSAGFLGGVIFNSAGTGNATTSSTVVNCVFNGNSAGFHGGVIYNSSGTGCATTSLNVKNCVFSGNSAGYNGGVMFNGAGISRATTSLNVKNCVFSGNWAGQDGGVMCNRSFPGDAAYLTVMNCLFSCNSATKCGGAMYHKFGTGFTTTNETVNNCVFIGNSAENGGAVYNFWSAPALTNCTFSSNSAYSGGGIYCHSDGNTMLTNCIMWGDTATQGHEIALEKWDESISYPAEITVRYGDVEGGASEVFVDTDCTLNWEQGNIDADPCFVEPGYCDANGVWINGDYHLLPDSPCIDTGEKNYIAEPNEKDLDGKPRIIGCQIDMGAYEYGQLISAEVRIVPRTMNLASEGKWLSCSISLPEDYNVADIDSDSILLECEIEPESLHVDELVQLATARFSRCDVQDILSVGKVELTITGKLTDGTVFEATDVITVIDKGREK